MPQEYTWIIMTLLTAFSLIISIPMAWNGIVGILGLFIKRKTRIIPPSDKKLRFAVITCARNEAQVIGKLIDSIKRQDYPDELYDIYVIADNCTDDKTASEAKAHGARVFERFNKTEVGKGFALKWGFEKIFAQENSDYDAICVFDADNLAEKNFLSRMNDALCAGYDGAQGMREASNPYDNTVSGSYEIYWIMSNVLQNVSRHNVSLSAYLGGTGFALRADLVRDGRWDTSTIAEDSEFSVKKILEGKVIAAVSDAVFYDEQPTTWSVSLTQRFRWIFGIMQCVKTILNRKKQKGLKVKKNVRSVDAVMWLLLTPSIAMMPVIAVGTFFVPFLSVEFIRPLFLANLVYYAATYVVTVIGAMIIIAIGKKPLGKLWRSAFVFPIFMLPLSFMAFICLFKKRLDWKQIKHTNSKSIDDIA